MKYILLVACMAIAWLSRAQVVMTADKTDIIIGDQIKATMTINLSGGREWRNKDNAWPDSIPGMEIVSGPEIDEKNIESVRHTWNISVFDTGIVRIPSIPVVIRKGNNLDTFFTNDIPIRVNPVEPDSTGLIGIKDIIKQPFNLLYYKKYLPHLILLLAILAGVYYWWRKKNRKTEIVEEPVPEPLPHEWALRALNELEEKKLWQQGEIKEHYSKLTGILREYLERRYGIKAMEQTTDEILDQLRHQQLSAELMNDTASLLSVADLIKFAKADPGENIHAVAIGRVRRFVNETMSFPETGPQANQTTISDEAVE